ncbi:MAG: hypothetical protein ACUVR3_03055 [Candidatus Roseilinea sp.]
MATGIALIALAALVVGLAGLIVWWQLTVAKSAQLGHHVVAFLYDCYARRYDRVKQLQPVTLCCWPCQF